MENPNLREELTYLLEKEVGFTGKFILQKQCQRLNIDPDHILSENLKPLSDQIHWALKGFTGERKADEIRKGILEYKNALETKTTNIEGRQGVLDAIEAQLTIGSKKLIVGQGDEAVEAAKQAYDIFSNSELKDDIALKTKIKRNLAKAQGSTKKGREEAVETYHEVIKLGESSRNHYETALAWNGLGSLSWRTGKHRDSLQKYMLALKALKQMKAVSKRDKERKKRVEGRIQLGLGNTYLDLLDMEISIGHNERAIEIFMEQEDYSNVGLVYNNVSRVYEEMGQYAKAIDGYERSIHYCNKAGAMRLEGWTLTNLASTLVEDGRVDEARQHLERADNLLSNFTDPIAHSKLHCMYGKYHRERKEWQESEDHFRKSIDFIKDENSPDYLALAEEEFGLMHYKKRNNVEAREYLESALEWYTKKNETTRIEKISEILDSL